MQTYRQVSGIALAVVSLLWMSSVHAASPESSSPTSTSTITEAHAIALYGEPKYAANFKHFDWVNPHAPKGGELRLMGFGSFDSTNPYTLKGTSPFNTPGMFMYGFSELNETLLIGTGSYSPSADEAQSAYGLIAESLRYPEDFSWVEYNIRPTARFHDGHAIDAEDVVFSFNTLIKFGHPRFQQSLLDVERVESMSSDRVRFYFKKGAAKQAIFRTGELPILPQHYWQDKDFERASQVTPLLSGPYKIGKVEMGTSITLERVDDFWGHDLNVYRGRYNFDTILIDFYRDQSVAFEAFKSNEFDIFYDYTAKNWAEAYDFPAIEQGEVLQEAIQHDIPSGTQGFFFNTRRSLFQDVRVRQAISELFDFEWINQALFHDAYTRNLSYYPNSRYAHRGKPSAQERALLEPYRDQLPPELFEGSFQLSESKGDGNIRAKRRLASRLMQEAGWALQNGVLTHQTSGEKFEFELIYRQAGLKRVVLPFIKNLERIGIKVNARLVENAQYKSRLDQFDFDMMTFVLSQGLAPSYEQRDYFHSDLVSVVGSQNYAGVDDPVVDALIEKLIQSKSEESLINVMRALDRVLMFQHYHVPNWHIGMHRIAYWNKFARAEDALPYKLGTENWWTTAAKEPKAQ